MSRFRYPTDTDQFQEIRENDYFYVDKTDLIYKIVSSNKYVFIARPRRFGKSLLCTTMKAYFEGRKELFHDLKIMELEKEWKQYPVFHFTMSELKNLPISQAKSKLELLLSYYEEEYGENPKATTPGARLKSLIRKATAQTGQNSVVIFDEYDSPILQFMNDKAQLEQMRKMLKEFYQVLKDEGAYLRFVFITGITKFSQVSIFSELNNLMPISMDDEYSGLCGFTQNELNTVMRPCIEEYAEALGISTDDAYALLKKNYDGYHFSPNAQDVYAPFSLLRALKKRNTAHYWFESGTSSVLIDHLRRFPEFNPLDYDGVEVSDNAFNVPCENAATPIPLLYQSGYLSIDTYDKMLGSYILHFPNYEVRQGMVENLTEYLLDTKFQERDTAILGMARALYMGDLSKALYIMRSWIAGIPYDIITKKQWMENRSSEAFYKLLMYIVFSLLNSKVDTEVKSVLGRADVVITTETHIYVLELKVDKSVDDALAQIDDKGYAIPYEASGRILQKCGVTISTDARNITHWRVFDADGNVVDEQRF